MACPRGVTGLFGWSLILIAALVLLVPSASAQNCVDIFSSTSGTLNGFENIVALDITVEETTPSGTELYRLSWTDDCVDPPIITDDIFNTYFTVNDTEDCTWVVSVNTELTGVPDYPTPQDQIITQVAFTDFSNNTFECSVTLTHRIKDENTQKPNPGAADYVLDIFENMNTGYTIAEFNTSVHDTDGTQPNNQFSVIMDPDCPLQSTLLTYTSGMNARPVEYMLMQKVDFEVASIIPCTATFEDKGTPPLTTTTTITINVKDVNDEPPVFTNSYYYSAVSSVLSPGEPLDIFPGVITASDGDTGINAPVTFALENANPDVNGLEYFQIKANTGEVTLAKDLDNDFLLNERVLFIVQASDGSFTAPAILDVTLPPVPTTTASTTPGTTCEPCTCPTYTTELPTDCPTTPTEGTCTPCPTETTEVCTCPVVTCPTTPSEGTCTPCPTDTTMESTCPVVTCPTTPSEGTCTPCPTETTVECTCPVVTCPTTPSEGTCTPCPTDTTMECTCPVVTCPTTPSEGPTSTNSPTVTWDPALPPLTFKKESYVGDIYASFTTVFDVEVENNEGYGVTYSLRKDHRYSILSYRN